MILKTPDKSSPKFLALLPILSVYIASKFLKRQFSRGKLRKISEQFSCIFTEQLRWSVSKHTFFISELAFTSLRCFILRYGGFLRTRLICPTVFRFDELPNQLFLFRIEFSLLKSIGQCVQL